MGGVRNKVCKTCPPSSPQGVTEFGRAGQVRRASPDVCPALWQPEAIAVKVQAVGYTIGHTVGGHLAILNFWQEMGRKEQQQLRKTSSLLLGSPLASITGSDGSTVGPSTQGEIHTQKASSGRPAAKGIKKSPCALCWLKRDTVSTRLYL